MRLVKYTAGQAVFALATTLLDAQRYRRRDLARLYHGRWSIEEYYKTTKQMLVLEEFRGRSERLVRQELYAHFTMASLSRLLANYSEEAFREGPDGHGRPAVLANFRHTLHTVGRHLEGLFLQQAKAVGEALQRILDGIAASRQRRRPGRSYPGRSRKPETKWRNRKSIDSLTPPQIAPEPGFLKSMRFCHQVNAIDRARGLLEGGIVHRQLPETQEGLHIRIH